MTICNVCGGEKQPLFTSEYCPWCEMRSASNPVTHTVAYTPNRGRPLGSLIYVYRTPEDVNKRCASPGATLPTIRKVKSKSSIQWFYDTDRDCYYSGLYRIQESEADCVDAQDIWYID